jgi:hypothetical protein
MLISFTIDGKSYYAYRGMTWADWVDSRSQAYHLNFEVEPDGRIWDADTDDVLTDPEERVHILGTDKIIEGKEYQIGQ